MVYFKQSRGYFQFFTGFLEVTIMNCCPVCGEVMSYDEDSYGSYYVCSCGYVEED